LKNEREKSPERLYFIIAKELPADIIVNADTVMAAAAKALGLSVTTF
jgi:predicted DNA-binding protein (UPF0278 family)